MVGAEGLFAGADNICYDGIGSEGKQGLKRGMEVQKWYRWEWAKEPTRERVIDCHDCHARSRTWWRLESMDLSPYQSSHGHNSGSCIEAVKAVRYLTFIIFLSNCINFRLLILQTSVQKFISVSFLCFQGLQSLDISKFHKVMRPYLLQRWIHAPTQYIVVGIMWK